MILFYLYNALPYKQGTRKIYFSSPYKHRLDNMAKALCLNPVILTPTIGAEGKSSMGTHFPSYYSPPIIHDNTLLGYA
jgi:hypothetical protein